MNADFVYLLLKSTKVPKMCHDDKTIKLLIFVKIKIANLMKKMDNFGGPTVINKITLKIVSRE